MNDCPYCGNTPRSSDDHIFSEFLGGNTTIRSCKKCNDILGHSVEGPASSDLAPLVVILRRAGLTAPSTFVWKRAFRDESSGREYDIDSNLGSQPSIPLIERDAKGNIKSALYYDERMKRKFVKAFEGRGREVVVTDVPEHQIPIPPLRFQLALGSELRRLMMKMAVATADHAGKPDILDSETRMFLLGKKRDEKDEVCPCTMRDESVYAELDAFRLPLSHLVYVEGDGRTQQCYGVVQLYGLIQLYVILNKEAYRGQDFATIGRLSPTQGYVEDFQTASPIGLPRPPVSKIYNVKI